jgi:hypothetical protein
MAKIGTATAKGKSGKSYEFNVYPIDQAFKGIGAVYVVARQYKNTDGEDAYQAIYVGQTDDLSTRFNNHHKSDCFAKHKANCICTHVDDDEDSRLAKEGDLIKGLDPPCND